MGDERFTPPRVEPPAAPLGRVGFVASFVRNPLAAIPRAAYEEDYVALGGRRAPRAWVTSPTIIKAVLLDERDKFRKLTQIRLLRPLLGRGILTSEGADWRWQRQAASPMFRPEALDGYVPTFVRAAEDALERWHARPPDSVHAIDDDMTRASFDVIQRTVLPSADAARASAIQRDVRSLQRFGGWDILYASLNVPKWVPRPGMLAGARAAKSLRATVAGLFDERRRSTSPPDDLMARLIAARDPETNRAMDDEQLADNLLTFYLAGHETTAKALTWTLYLIARSPGWADALADEVESVTGGAALGATHLERLVKVQQVLKESMRLYPPAPLMSRQAIADAEIDGRTIRAGTSILIPIYVVHRHAKRWERPDEFDPERFSPTNEAAIPRYQYMPFGAGPRVCIGRSFAMAEATAMLATFVRRARFATVAGRDPIPVARITLMPRDGMFLRVTSR